MVAHNRLSVRMAAICRPVGLRRVNAGCKEIDQLHDWHGGCGQRTDTTVYYSVTHCEFCLSPFKWVIPTWPTHSGGSLSNRYSPAQPETSQCQLISQVPNHYELTESFWHTLNKMIWTRPPLSQWVLYGGLLASKDKNGNYVHINTNNYVHLITNFVCLVVMLK